MRSFILIVIIFTSLVLTSSVSAKDGIGSPIQMLPWQEVNNILPKYSKFTVMDVETGEKFRVQRRAGNRHADVQPLTSEDTKIMKEIYEGEWSWRRKAIIVIHEGQWIAASMHGMPHGAGALKNNFPGHFCIHFYNSTTHRTNSMDLSHKLMILKAAGKLKEYVTSAEPTELIYAFIGGLKQKDPDILSIISLQNIEWNLYLPSIQNVKLNDTSTIIEAQQDLSLELFVDIEWRDAHSKNERFKGEVYLFRFAPFDQWQIDSERLLKDIGISK